MTVSSKLFSSSLLVLAITGGIGGALLIGYVLDNLVRTFLSLNPTSEISTLILLFIVLILLTIAGTTVLIMALKVENKKMKLAIIICSTVVPLTIEIVDLTIRAHFIIKDYSEALYMLPVGA